MNSIFSTPSGKPIIQNVVQPQSEVRPASVVPQSPAAAPPLGAKRVGYGLPCAEWKTYYAADLKACPVRKSPERATADSVSAPPVSSRDPDGAALEEERERSLRQ